MTERWTRIRKSQKTVKSLTTNSKRGPLANVFIGDEWHVPGHVELTQDGKFLAWKYGKIKKGGHQLKNAPAFLLERFIQLAEVGSEGGGRDILKFARKYGVLYLCRDHALPSIHRELENPSPDDLRKGGMFARCGLRVNSKGCFEESIEVWRRYANQARALLNLTEALKKGNKGDREDWETISRQVGSIGYKTIKGVMTRLTVLPKAKSEQRFVLSGAVNHWLFYAQVRPAFYLTEIGPQIQLGNRTVFGALALQLMLAVSQTQGPASCSNCGNFYAPTRKPNPNRKNYCPSCGRGAALRNASQKYRDK